LKDEGFNCHILPNGSWSCFNPAEGVAEKSAEEPGGLARIWEATRNVIKAAPLLGELWDAEIEFGIVVLDVLFGDDEEEAEEEVDPTKAPVDEIGSKKAKESDKAKGTDEAKEAGKAKEAGEAKEPEYPKSIVVELGPDGKTVMNDLRNDIEAHFPDKEKYWDAMEKYATHTAQQYGNAKQRVIWEPETFWKVYFIDKMEKSGVKVSPTMTVPDVVAEVYDLENPKKGEDGKPIPNFTIDGSGKKKGKGGGKVGGAGKGGNGKKSDKGKAPITR